MTGLKKLTYLVGILTTGAILTLLSSYNIQRYQAAVSENCPVRPGNYQGFCYESLPAGGFPLPFLFDQPFTATKGTLGFDDRIQPFLFIGNLLAYSLLTLIIVLGIYTLLNRSKSTET